MTSEIYRFTVNADHHQFYLEDGSDWYERRPHLWLPKAYEDRVDVLPGVIAVGTSRYGHNISVVIEVSDGAPASEPLEEWDHVVECAIASKSEYLFLTNPTTYVDDTAKFKIKIQSGTFRARIYYGNLNSTRGNAEMDGDDHYRIVLWPDRYIEPRVLKRKPRASASE